MTHDSVRIGLVSISDRASSGAYEDQGLPALKAWFGEVLANPVEFVTGDPDEQAGSRRHCRAADGEGVRSS